MSRKHLLITLLAMTGALTVASSALAISGAGGIALEFPIGARYNALGEAGSALAQDATAMWWNPGGLAFATDEHNSRLHAMQSKLVPDLADDIALYWGGYVSRKWGGSLGFNITYLSMGDQLATDDSGTEGDSFTSNMWAAGLTYGTRLSPNLGFGIGFKFFRDNLAPDSVLQDGQGGSGSTFAADAGILWKVPSLRSNFAVVMSNLGPNITHVDEDQSDPLPRKLTFGVAHSLMHSEATALLLVGDLLVPLLSWDDNEDDYGLGTDFGETEWGVGVEWSYVQSLFIRLGYKKGTGQIEDMTWGLGMHFGRWVGKNIIFGYASVPQAEGLKNVNRFSIGFDF